MTYLTLKIGSMVNQDHYPSNSEKLDEQTDRRTDAEGYNNTPSAKYGRGLKTVHEKVLLKL